jgi:hypothetical protein
MLEPDLTRTMIDEDEEPDADYEQAFPARLHYLLDVLEKDGLADVCSFQSHGRAFVVRDKEAFVKDILPKYVDSLFALPHRILWLQRLSLLSPLSSGSSLSPIKVVPAESMGLVPATAQPLRVQTDHSWYACHLSVASLK